MALARRRIAKRARPAPSVTAPALLVGGTDTVFRDFVHTLFSVTGRLELIRERVGALYGISGAQFTILMGTLHHQRTSGVSIGVLAERLHLRATFVTTQCNKLRASGFVNKHDNPDDGRGVLLSPQRGGCRAARRDAAARLGVERSHLRRTLAKRFRDHAPRERAPHGLNGRCARHRRTAHEASAPEDRVATSARRPSGRRWFVCSSRRLPRRRRFRCTSRVPSGPADPRRRRT